MLHIQIILQYFYKLLVRTKNLITQAHLEHQCLVLQTKPKQQKIITQRVGRQFQYSSGLSLGLRSRSPSKEKQITELLRIKLSLVSLEVFLYMIDTNFYMAMHCSVSCFSLSFPPKLPSFIGRLLPLIYPPSLDPSRLLVCLRAFLRILVSSGLC